MQVPAFPKLHTQTNKTNITFHFRLFPHFCRSTLTKQSKEKKRRKAEKKRRKQKKKKEMYFNLTTVI